MFSKSCEYGILAAIFIARHSKKGLRVNLKTIANEIDSPIAFTAKILQSLAGQGVIESVKGKYGGYAVAGEASLLDVVNAIDGHKLFQGCGLGLPDCNAQMPCPLHDQITATRNALQKNLADILLFQLADDLEAGKSFVRR